MTEKVILEIYFFMKSNFEAINLLHKADLNKKSGKLSITKIIIFFLNHT